MIGDKKIQPFNAGIYLHKRSHIFALALNQAFYYTIEFLWNNKALDKDKTDNSRVLVHAYCRCLDGQMVDASGEITRKQLYNDYGDESNYTEIEFLTAAKVHAYIRAGLLEKPRRREIEQLVLHIQNNHVLYQPNFGQEHKQ
jgi:hypothetical protein